MNIAISDALNYLLKWVLVLTKIMIFMVEDRVNTEKALEVLRAQVVEIQTLGGGD